jgi:hypothetical protein
MANFPSSASSISSLAPNGEPATCHLFQTKTKLLGKPYRVESRVSSDPLRALSGAVAKISDVNVRNLSQLCDEFKFMKLAETVGDWQAGCPLIDSVIRGELGLARDALEERLESQDRKMLMLDEAVHRQWEL